MTVINLSTLQYSIKNPTSSISLPASTRIVGGAIVRSIRNFPYVASIQSDAGFFCAGTIIAPYWILSASHCLVAFERVRVFIKIPYKIG